MRIPAIGFKPGIVSRGTRADWALRQERAHRGWWPFSYTIFEELENDWQPRDEPLLDRLYASLRAGDGVYKITSARRFASFDTQVIGVARDLLDDVDRFAVHDAACSSGVTSLDLLERLERTKKKVQLRATDWYDRLYIVRMEKLPWTVIFDAEFEPLQIVWRNLVLSAYHPELWRFPVNRIVQFRCRQNAVRAAKAMLAVIKPPSPGETVDAPGGYVRCVSLFHPRCRAQAATDPEFELARENVFAPQSRRYHLIRVMNALTPKHFSEQKIIQAITALIGTLEDGGLLVLGRTSDDYINTLHGSIYQLRRNRLHLIAHADAPYELDRSIRALRVVQ